MDKKRQGKINRNKGAIFEREVVKKIPNAKRVVRGDWGVSATDIIIEGLNHLKIDCKKHQKHKHHTLFEEIEEKYCEKKDEAVLITQKGGSKKTLATVDLDFFIELLEKYVK